MPIFDPSQYELWGRRIPVPGDAGNQILPLNSEIAHNIARMLQSMGLDKASFEQSFTLPSGIEIVYVGRGVSTGWNNGTIMSYREPSPTAHTPYTRPGNPLRTPPVRTDIEWTYVPCAGEHDLGRYIFTESRAGCLGAYTWAFPVAYVMGWEVDRVTEQGTIAYFYFDKFDMNNPSSKGTIRIDMSPFEFVSNNGIRSCRYDIDLKYLYGAYNMYFDNKISESDYRRIEITHSFQYGLPEQMDHHISHIQSAIDESLREVNQW